MEITQRKLLEQKAQEARRLLLATIGKVGSGHFGGSLSVIDVVTVLYFDAMNIDPLDPERPDRDKLVMSKGHAGPTLYCVLAMKGYFPLDWLSTLNMPGTNLPSHCDMIRTPGIDMTAGSLGQGISAAVGLALAAKVAKSDEYIYSIIGDGESQEGSVWEASMTAAHYKLDNLILFLDQNKCQVDGYVDDVMSLLDPAEKWKSFGFNTYQIDGHDLELISETIKTAKKTADGKPSMIILDTIKGKGISSIEALGPASHSFAVTPEKVQEFLNELDEKVE